VEVDDNLCKYNKKTRGGKTAGDKNESPKAYPLIYPDLDYPFWIIRFGLSKFGYTFRR
jgi:hypothetical protein